MRLRKVTWCHLCHLKIQAVTYLKLSEARKIYLELQVTSGWSYGVFDLMLLISVQFSSAVELSSVELSWVQLSWVQLSSVEFSSGEFSSVYFIEAPLLNFIKATFYLSNFSKSRTQRLTDLQNERQTNSNGRITSSLAEVKAKVKWHPFLETQCIWCCVNV